MVELKCVLIMKYEVRYQNRGHVFNLHFLKSTINFYCHSMVLDPVSEHGMTTQNVDFHDGMRLAFKCYLTI